MVKKNGWQFPPPKFQVIAVTVFCLLVAAFYVFFAPFVGGRIWEYVLTGVYSPVALLVFVLYVRCTTINPAGPRIMSIFATGMNEDDMARDLSSNFDETGSQLQASPSDVSRSSNFAANSSQRGSVGDAQRVESVPRKYCYNPLAIFCCVFVHEDCRRNEDTAEQQGNSEETLFCMFCNFEVLYNSKHCRSCNKCVYGFDHHCKWLNNCVGRNNYMTFIALMSASLLWLITEAAIGIAVIVRVFVNKKSMETEIVNRLGKSFSRAPFATVVGLCTVVSILACFYLGEILLFHMILMKRGITTYEYVVAMRLRAMSEAPDGASVDEEMQSVHNSPTGSDTTGFSGGSSLGQPKVLDNQDEVISQLDSCMVPSTVDPDAPRSERSKRSVKLNAWKLANLDPNEATRAAARARELSSVRRPIDNRHLQNNDIRSGTSINSFDTSQGGRDENDTDSHGI